MTLRLADPKALYKVEVDISVPLEDGGFEEMGFTAQFAFPASEDLEAINRTGLLALTGQEDKDVWTDARVLTKYLKGWEGILDPAGRPIKFSASALKRMLKVPYWPGATARAFVRWARGYPEGNSEPPRLN